MLSWPPCCVWPPKYGNGPLERSIAAALEIACGIDWDPNVRCYADAVERLAFRSDIELGG